MGNCPVLGHHQDTKQAVIFDLDKRLTTDFSKVLIFGSLSHDKKISAVLCYNF